MEEKIVTIHLDGGLVMMVEGLGEKQKYEISNLSCQIALAQPIVSRDSTKGIAAARNRIKAIPV